MSEILRMIQSANTVPGINSRMVYCTPELAERVLTMNTRNRRIANSVVEKYVVEINNGDWLPIASGIGIDEKGVLADGQHRLTAIVMSGQTVPILFVWGLPSASQEKADRQFRRSIFAALHLSGMDVTLKGVQIATFLARRAMGNAQSGSPADSEIKAALAAHDEGIRYITGRIRSNDRGISPAGTMAAFALAYEVNQDKTKEFVERFLDPIGIAHDDPAYRLRRHMTDSARSYRMGGSRQFEDWMAACYAINAHFAGQKIVAVRKTQDDIWADGKPPTGRKE